MLRCVPFALLTALALASCSRQSPSFEGQEVPGSFDANGKRYVIRLDAPGVIEDDAVRYTADFGARTFYFQDRKLLRHLFVGKWDAFDSLEPAEREEIRSIAKAAIGLLEQSERDGKPLSSVSKEHLKILRHFLSQ